MCTLAVHWGWLDTVPGFPDRLRENPPRQGFFEHPEYLAVRVRIYPPRGRTSSMWPTIPAGASRRSSASPGRRSTKPAASSGSRQGARRRWWDASSPISPPIAEALARRRARRDPGSPLVFHRDGIRHSPLAHGVAHRLSGGRGADPLPPRLSPHCRAQPDPRERPRARRHAPDRAQEPRHLRPL